MVSTSSISILDRDSTGSGHYDGLVMPADCLKTTCSTGPHQRSRHRLRWIHQGSGTYSARVILLPLIRDLEDGSPTVGLRNAISTSDHDGSFRDAIAGRHAELFQVHNDVSVATYLCTGVSLGDNMHSGTPAELPGPEESLSVVAGASPSSPFPSVPLPAPAATVTMESPESATMAMVSPSEFKKYPVEGVWTSGYGGSRYLCRRCSLSPQFSV